MPTGTDPDELSRFLFELGNRQVTAGELEAAQATFERVCALEAARDNAHQFAVARGQIADVLQRHGEPDEALRIRRKEQLPVYTRLGDVRAVAVTQAKIADVLQARGELYEALRIRRDEVLPVLQRVGDVRAAALTQSQIADVLQDLGRRLRTNS